MIAKSCSIGLKSGEYGGRKRRVCPACSIICLVAAVLWGQFFEQVALEPVVEQGSVGAAFEQDRSEQPFALFGRDQAGARTPFATAFTVYLLPPKTPTMKRSGRNDKML